eukprot:TRINITY_DN11157_c0_g1_i1.p1 TRINITY_DN11157_c0_g1~~TRINITY_DN11157_c0_g1_i1.p1  ORF type:complete len:207 (+),score=38.54 TRINITY_DN11157_c0_g1_i1:47-667(+)
MKLLLLISTVLAISLAQPAIPEEFSLKFTMAQSEDVNLLESVQTVYQNIKTGHQRSDATIGLNKSQTYVEEQSDGSSIIYILADGKCQKFHSQGPIIPMFEFVKDSKYTKPCLVNLVEGNNYHYSDEDFTYNLCLGLHGDKADTPMGMSLIVDIPGSSPVFESVFFDSFTPGAPNPSMFDIPKICDGVETTKKGGVLPSYSSLLRY